MTDRRDSETRLDGALTRLDRATTFVERPVRSLGPRSVLNPLPHAGTISTFLLLVVIITGLYITLFFSFGHAASYDSVVAMEDHAIQRVARAIHRYASALLVVTTLVHGWRIFAAKRFTSRPRRWRWATGVASLVLVWFSGVTGYWLVWDRRAAAISEVTARLLEPLPRMDGFVIDHLLGVSPGTGSGFLFGIWLVHLGLSALLGYAVYRHVRGTRFAWLPPKHWMAIVSGLLVVASLLVPLGMLGPARPDQMVADMPLDPFVLFLLPPLLSTWQWPTVAVLLAAGTILVLLPRLLRRADRDPVEVDVDACTGCELCVVDCPYGAITMSEGSDNDQRGVAVVDPRACVACGICIGSCAFDALSFTDVVADPVEVHGRAVAIACERQIGLDGKLEGADATISVRCSGMFAPTSARDLRDRGATEVTLVGCSPAECRYGVGSQLAAERFAGSRAPHPPRALAEMIHAVPPELDALDTSRLAGPAAVVALSVAMVVAGTRAPFTTDTDEAALRIVVDHTPGSVIAETGERSAALDSVVIELDGRQQVPMRFGAASGAIVGFDDRELPIGRHDLRVVAGEGAAVLFDGTVDLASRQRFVVTATDVPPAPDAETGREVFDSRAAGCAVCHSTEAGRDGVGPTLHAIAGVAGDRVPGLDAEGYLRQSILLPDQYVVDGWPAGQMLPIYRERLSAEELESLLTYLLTLEEVE